MSSGKQFFAIGRRTGFSQAPHQHPDMQVVHGRELGRYGLWSEIIELLMPKPLYKRCKFFIKTEQRRMIDKKINSVKNEVYVMNFVLKLFIG